MGHDEPADQPRGDAPTRRPGIFQLAFAALKLDAERFGEVLPEKMARAGLKRFFVLHHGLDAERVHCAGELLPFALRAGQHRHRHPFLGEFAVNIHENAVGFFYRLGLRGMGGVPFLPKEFGGAQKEPRAHLPADDVGPLVDEQR